MGINLTVSAEQYTVPWTEVMDVSAEECRIVISPRSDLPQLVLGQRWTGKVPPSAFVALARTGLPARLRNDEVDTALRCILGWARSSELGDARDCLRCGGRLAVTRERILTGGFANVEVVLCDVERRVCQRCGAAYPLDSDQIGVGDLLFALGRAWDEPESDWVTGVETMLRPRGFFRRPRGSLEVRLRAPGSQRPPPGDIHLAVLNAMCGESPAD